MHVTLDRDRCTGLGICESIAPDHFEIADDGAVVVLRDDVAPNERATLEDAVRSCPTGALRLATQPEPAAPPATQPAAQPATQPAAQPATQPEPATQPAGPDAP